MITFEEHRRYADECLRLAREAKDKAQQQALLEMATAWTQVAALEDDKLPAAPKVQTKSGFRNSRSSPSTDGVVATITPFLTGQAFGPKIIRSMSAAFVGACESLHLEVGDDQTTRMVAKKIIELAQRGIRDPETLRRMTLEEFHPSPSA